MSLEDDLPWVVDDNNNVQPGQQYPILARFADHDHAAAFIGTLPGHQTGRYGLTGPGEDDVLDFFEMLDKLEDRLDGVTEPLTRDDNADVLRIARIADRFRLQYAEVYQRAVALVQRFLTEVMGVKSDTVVAGSTKKKRTPVTKAPSTWQGGLRP